MRASRAFKLAAGVAILAMAAACSDPGHAVRHSGASTIKGMKATTGPPIRVAAVTPAANAAKVNGAAPIQVSFSAPMASGSPLPTIHPSVAGSWKHNGASMVFTPTTPFAPLTKVTVTVPAGASGVRSEAGGMLPAPVTDGFETAAPSTLRVQQLFAKLGYLPLTWSPSGADIAPGNSAAQAAAAYAPPQGSFTWQGDYPSTLRGMWEPGASGVMMRGAVMAFESDHGMAVDGALGPHVWSALLTAVAAGRTSPNGYTYAVGSKSSPETLTIWHNGRQVFHALANTGIPGQDTTSGTFPVYERLRNQIMRGTNPDGSHYADPVQFVAYFNGSDAVHYFPRGSYGSPQSLGCIELPLGAAGTAWPYLTYGSLVTVTG